MKKVSYVAFLMILLMAQSAFACNMEKKASNNAVEAATEGGTGTTTDTPSAPAAH
jgi:hypothetical protein